MFMWRTVSCIVGRRYLLCRVFSWQNSVSLSLLHFVFQGQAFLLLQVSLDFLLLHSNLLWWKGHLFLVLVLGLVDLHRTIRFQLWITVILNGLPWKWTRILLSFLRLHPSTAFWTLSLTVKATSFLLRSSKSFMVTDTIFLFEYCSISDMSSEDVVASMVLEFGEDLKKKKKKQRLFQINTLLKVLFFLFNSQKQKKKKPNWQMGVLCIAMENVNCSFRTFFEIIIDPQAIVNNNTERSCVLYPVSPNGLTI